MPRRLHPGVFAFEIQRRSLGQKITHLKQFELPVSQRFFFANTASVVSSKNFRPLASNFRKSLCSGQGLPVPHQPGPNGHGYSVISRSKIPTMSANRISSGGRDKR
jgi:hypothetical protein